MLWEGLEVSSRRRFGRWAAVAATALAMIAMAPLSALAEPVSPTTGAEHGGESPPDATCEFDLGTTTCTTVVETLETAERTVFSGCLAGPPPGVAGVRRQTFLDTFLVSTTTITRSRGRRGPVYEVSTATTSELLSSQLVDSSCTPIAPAG